MTTTTETPLNVRQADGLRQLANLIEANAHIAPLMVSTLEKMLVSVGHGLDTSPQDDLLAFLRVAGPVARKNYESDDWMAVDIALSDAVELYVYTRRESVCERVVTGTETVTKTVPDPDALASVPTIEVTETVEHVEWVCRPLLADQSGKDTPK